MPSEPVLTIAHRAFIGSARRAVLSTIAPDGRPRLVPICFALADIRPVLYTPLDDKPKRTGDTLELARVRDIRADPRVSVLFDHWDEDWTRLGWLRADGTAELVMPGQGGPHELEHTAAVTALRARYPQYNGHHLEDRPLIRITLGRVTAWGRRGP